MHFEPTLRHDASPGTRSSAREEISSKELDKDANLSSTVDIDRMSASGETGPPLPDNGNQTPDTRRTDLEFEDQSATVDRRVRERTAALEAANVELKAFVSFVTHELRQPLLAIDGFAQLLQECGDAQIGVDAKHYLTRIVSAKQRMADLIVALLKLSRLEHRDMDCREVDIRSMVLQIVEDLRVQESDRQIEVTIERLPSIRADPVLMRQTFENLLGNAFKYTRRRPDVRIHVGYFRSHEEIVLFVRDNGAGFDMHNAEKLFGLFQRLHRAEEFEGVGVGLALVRRIIDVHGGRVWAEGACGIGATMYVALPQ